MLFLFAILASSVLGTQDGLLGVCGVYKAAFPDGHTEADLSNLIVDYLPAELSLEEEVVNTLPEMTTSDFVEVYESQLVFCEEREAEVAAAVLELQSEDSLSTETEELLHVALFEAAAVLSQSTTDSSRRQLVTGVILGAGSSVGSYAAGAGVVPSAAGSYATGGAIGVAEGFVAVEMGAVFLVGAGFIFVGVMLALIWKDCCRRRRRKLHGLTQQAMAALKRESRRTLTGSESVEITTTEIIAACSHGVPSFVCQLSTVALAQVVTSQFCGGNNLEVCNANLQYALGYASAVLNNN